MSKIRVMIVEDSLVVREMLSHIVTSDPRLEVVSLVASGEAALRAIDITHPQVISLDIRLPGMDGFETTQQIMSLRPTPIVVISNDVDDRSLNISMNALRAGALAVLEKPPSFDSADADFVAKRICDQLVAMSSVMVVRQRFARDLKIASASTSNSDSGAGTVSGTVSGAVAKVESNSNQSPPSEPQGGGQRTSTAPVKAFLPNNRYAMLGIVASSGGPSALIEVLQALPKNFHLPIVIVQHITDSFLESFATWLGSESPFPAVIVREKTVAVASVIYMAAAGHHLVLVSGHLQLSAEEPVSMQRPSGTVLLRSLARSLGPSAIGVVLTGMGDDGAAGLLELRQAGGFTIAEHESTAVVYGMPACAQQLGAACEMLPVDKIGKRIVELVEVDAWSEKYAK